MMASKRRRRSTNSGAVRKLPSGRFQAKIQGPDGRYHPAPETFEAKVDAEAWLKVQRRRIVDGDWQAPVKASKASADTGTVNQVFESWIRDRDHIEATTANLYRDQFKRLIQPAFGDSAIGSITPEEVSEWRAAFDPAHPTQKNQAYWLLGSIAEYAVAHDLISASPVAARKPAKKKPKENVVLTPSEVAQLVEAMPEHYRAMVQIAAWCGLRFGELTALQRGDIDLKARTIKVQRGAVRLGDERVLKSPKSKAGQRTVVMPSLIVQAVRHHLDTFVGPERSALVFPGEHGQLMAPSTLYKPFYRARKEIGFPKMRWHDLRHTAGTLSTQAGATIKEVQDRLGHATPSAALRYQHVAAARQVWVADALDKLAADDLND